MCLMPHKPWLVLYLGCRLHFLNTHFKEDSILCVGVRVCTCVGDTSVCVLMMQQSEVPC